MCKIGILLTLFVFCVASGGSSAVSAERPEATLYGDTDRRLHVICDFENSGMLNSADKREVVRLKTPSEHVNPKTYVDREEYFVISGREGKKYLAFGSVKHRLPKEDFPELKLFKENIRLYTFRRTGLGEKSVGVDYKGDIWSIGDDGTVAKAGQAEYRHVIKPSGEKIRLFMHRGLAPDAKWTVDFDDMIFQEQADGKLHQAGFVDWRVIQLPEGGNATILMTKGMFKDSKWAGRYNGKLYQDK